MNPELLEEARELLNAMRQHELTLATAESCTGGLISAYLTEIAGSSDVIERGFVTYTNQAKTDLLGVPEDMLKRHGAVSREVARAMALGALEHSPADIAVAVTGIAGPGGGSADKPVGLVFFAAARRGVDVAHKRCEFGDVGRADVRERTVAEAIRLAGSLL